MMIMSQAEEYELDIVPPQADTCTLCSLLKKVPNLLRILLAVPRLPFHVLTGCDSVFIHACRLSFRFNLPIFSTWPV